MIRDLLAFLVTGALLALVWLDGNSLVNAALVGAFCGLAVREVIARGEFPGGSHAEWDGDGGTR